MDFRTVEDACPYDFVYPSHSAGVRSKNERVYIVFPVLHFVVPGTRGVPEPKGGCKGGTCGERSPF